MKSKEMICNQCGEKDLKITGMIEHSNKMVYTCVYCGHNQFYGDKK